MKTARNLIFLAALLCLLPSCQIAEFLAHAFENTSVQPAYAILPRPTLVLVDDPSNTLPDSTLKALFAQIVETAVSKNVEKITFIPQQALVELQSRAGAGFAKMAVNRVGASLNADQVIYVRIESLDLRAQPGLATPQIAIRVKVVDSKTGQRLFPVVKGGESDLTDSGERGKLIDVTLGFQSVDVDQAGVVTSLYRSLIDLAAAQTAELFYRHEAREKPASDT